jgi:prophage DNA circulation protein
MSDRYKAQLDGFELDIESIDDGFQKALVKYEYPFSDAVDMDDMGARARTVTFRCFFWDETYEIHKGFVAHVQQDRVYQLVHPAYGLLYGRVEQVGVRHDDRVQTAEIDVMFVEEVAAGDELPLDERIVPQVEAAFALGQQQQMSELAEYIRERVGTALGSDIVTKALDTGRGILEQFDGIAWNAREAVSEIDSIVRSLESSAMAAANPANSLIATIDYGVTLPGRVISTIARVVERYAEAAGTVLSAPSQLINNIMQSVGELTAVAYPLRRHLRSVAAQYTALRLVYIYDADERKRQRQKRIERSPAWDLNGAYIRIEKTEQILTLNELERSLETMRRNIQLAVDENRSVTALKDCARLLMYHVNEIKLEREKIVAVSVDRAIPLHILCLRHGLPYTYAERILSLNPWIRNPSRVEGEVLIYVR